MDTVYIYFSFILGFKTRTSSKNILRDLPIPPKLYVHISHYFCEIVLD